jgi:hypothetical protein
MREHIQAMAAGACPICGRGDSEIPAVWRATARVRRRMGVKPGQSGIGLIAICRECTVRPDLLELIEERALEQLAEGAMVF